MHLQSSELHSYDLHEPGGDKNAAIGLLGGIELFYFYIPARTRAPIPHTSYATRRPAQIGPAAPTTVTLVVRRSLFDFVDTQRSCSQAISSGPREAEPRGVAAVGDEEQPEGGVPVDVDKELEGAHAERLDGELLERRVRWEAQVEERREERVERLRTWERSGVEYVGEYVRE